MPQVKEGLQPDRITVKLPLYEDNTDRVDGRFSGKYQKYRDDLIDYVTRVIQVENVTVMERLALDRQEAEQLLQQMEAEGILIPMEEENRYRLKI